MVFGDVLRQQTGTERVTNTAHETFVTLRLNGKGAIRRNVGEGKTPQPFTGYRVTSGQFIYSRIDARNGAFAIIPKSLDGAVVSKDFPVFDIDRSMIDPRFLLLCVSNEQFVDGIRKLSFGATNRQRVKEEVFLNLPLELPPLDEQRRIATILDKTDELRTKRREALAHLDTLAQSVFHSMFGDPVRNDLNWPLEAFGHVTTSRLGKMLDKKTQTGNFRFKYLRNANVQWFKINTDDLLEMDFSPADQVEFALRRGDVLVCEGGEPGRAAIWRDDVPACFFQKALHRVRPHADVLAPEYLVQLLWSLAKGGGLDDHVTSATIAHLTGEKLKRIRIPVPPLDLQRTFATRVAAVERLKELHRKQLAELDTLFASLQHRAFKGEL